MANLVPSCRRLSWTNATGRPSRYVGWRLGYPRCRGWRQCLPDIDAQGRCGLMPEPAWDVEIRLSGSWGRVCWFPLPTQGDLRKRWGRVWPHPLCSLTLGREVAQGPERERRVGSGSLTNYPKDVGLRKNMVRSLGS